MAQYIDKDKVVAEIKKKIRTEQGYSSGDAECGYRDCARDILSFLNTLQIKEVDLEKDEPVSKDLEEAACEYADGENPTCPCEECLIKTFKAGALWQKEHLWKDAQGDDLPEIDKEVIALIEAFGHYKVIFAHRVDENAEIHTSIDGKPLVLHPKKHDKGGWNIPNIKWWLDIELPKMEE